jgi:hypothetical protein
MTESSGNGINAFGSKDRKHLFAEHLNFIARVVTRSGFDTVGELIEVDDNFLILRHKNGCRTRVRTRDISAIAEIERR